MGNLNGNVGPNAVISLSTPEGALVSSLGPGTYAIHVTDVATNHNFHLEGAGVNLATSIDATETADWTVDFLDAYYTYRCDRHANLNGSFTSGNPAALVAPAPTPAPAPVFTPAPVTVTPTPTPTPVPTPTLNRPGAVRHVAGARRDGQGRPQRQGRADRDEGRQSGEHAARRRLQVQSSPTSPRSATSRSARSAGATKGLTSRAFTGTRTITVDLTRGQWKLYSAANEQAVFSFFRVTK